MFNDKNLDSFLDQFNYDIRISGNARWIDQKCTPDVVCIIADCILNYVEHDENLEFSTKEIWDSSYAKEVSDLFSKPDVHSVNAQNEYDKFFQQPMELLAYSGVLSKEKKGNRNIYSVKNVELLSYIAVRERNALKFLTHYIKHVLSDSDLYDYFETFLDNPNVNNFSKLKSVFEKFTIKYTSINTEVECRRIFTKILNPLAFDVKSYGTESGRLSSQKIIYDQLMFNRLNFRDLYTNKPKDITRNEHEPTLSEKLKLERFWKYNSNKAKKLLRKFNDEFFDSISEHHDDLANSEATHIHHIFPEALYPVISGSIENLIALSPSQHLNRAHPLGKTQEVNRDYQYLLLISKTSKIRDNLAQDSIPQIYDFDKLKEVLAVGLDDENVYEIPYLDFPSISRTIDNYYA